MTAEIAVMNREAIALAADSAVTMRGEDGEKVFLSANKIFALSKRQPIAAMIYGGAAMMGVPWEPALKLFRKELGDKVFATVAEYGSRLLKFLESHRGLFSVKQRHEFCLDQIITVLTLIRQSAEHRRHLRRRDDPSDKTPYSEDLSRVVENYLAFWKKAKYIPRSGAKHLAAVRSKYRKAIQEIIPEVFDGIPLNRGLIEKMAVIAVNSLVKCPHDFEWPSATGLVIAGFGRDEMFPAITAYTLHGISHGKLYYRTDLSQKVDTENSATIVPFAQKEMVFAFMEGVDPMYQSSIEEDNRMLLSQFPPLVIDGCKFLDDATKKKLKEKFLREGDVFARDYSEGLSKFRHENFVRPVIRLVDMLPKSELATLAESMVNLTSLRRKISMQTETVGGPIDVALISKGDGLVWIKRKHYFDPNLNHQFLHNYDQG